MNNTNKKQQKETTPPVSAAQSWRDKLNKKLNSQQGGRTGTPRNVRSTNSNRFGSSFPISTARKSKKGHRPG